MFKIQHIEESLYYAILAVDVIEHLCVNLGIHCPLAHSHGVGIVEVPSNPKNHLNSTYPWWLSL